MTTIQQVYITMYEGFTDTNDIPLRRRLKMIRAENPNLYRMFMEEKTDNTTKESEGEPLK
jgi:hypothetical protein